MKKLLHVALLVFSLISVLNAQKITSKSFNEVMELSGINKQMLEYPSLVKAGMTSSKNQNNDMSDKEFSQMLSVVDEAFKPSKILTSIGIEIKKNVSQKDAKSLLKWYKSDIGKYITKAEEDSSTAQAYMQMIKEVKVLLKNQKKVFFAKRIDKLLKSTQMVVELQINTAIAIFTAMNKPSKSDMTIFRSQISRQKHIIEKNAHEMIILSYVYAYKNISNEDLEKYMNFLNQKSTIKFNDSATRGIVKALNNSSQQLATKLSQNL